MGGIITNQPAGGDESPQGWLDTRPYRVHIPGMAHDLCDHGCAAVVRWVLPVFSLRGWKSPTVLKVPGTRSVWRLHVCNPLRESEVYQRSGIGGQRTVLR